MNTLKSELLKAMLFILGLLANKTLCKLVLSRNSLSPQGLAQMLYNLAFSPSLTELDLSCVTFSPQANATVLNELGEALSKILTFNTTLLHLNFWNTKIR